MLMFSRRMSSSVVPAKKMIQTVIDNPAGFQAVNMRILSDHCVSLHEPKVSLILDDADQTSKVLVTHPDQVQVKVDVFYETMSTIGRIHGTDYDDPLILTYILKGNNIQREK
jgi:hypothetical protein